MLSNKKIIIISDLHIGGDDIVEDFVCEKELISFLETHGRYNGDLELLILGDFFDLWKVEETEDDKVNFMIKKYQTLFDALKIFGAKHKITVIPGNHDHALAYNKKYQEDLAEYNMEVDPSQFFKREFKSGERVFKVIGEHGNQVEDGTKFQEFGMPTDGSLAYYLNKVFVYKLMRMGNENKSPYWLRNLDNMDLDLIPHWALSKYFYYELGPFLKGLMIPMFILFGFAVPYFIFDVITEFYQPQFIKPLLVLLDTNTFFKILIFLLYFDMFLVIIFIFMWFLKRELKKRLREYGVHSFKEIMHSRYSGYKKRAKEVMSGENTFKEKADFYVTGHTHVAGLHYSKEEGVCFADTGSWRQLMKRISTRFQFPSVYVPYFSLTYITFEPIEGDRISIQLRKWPKDFTPKLTVLERFATKSKQMPKPVREDKLVNELKLPLAKMQKKQ